MIGNGDTRIASFVFMNGKKTVIHKRTVQSFVSAFAEAGGLLDILFLILFVLHWFFIAPFDDIHDLQSFYLMYKESLGSNIDDETEAGNGIGFALLYWLSERVFCCVSKNCCKSDKDEEEDLTLEKIDD